MLKRLPAHISLITELSPTAREVELTFPEPLGFIPGAFVNVFMTEGETKMRRAYSISSDEGVQNKISLTIRKGSTGGMSERFWEPSVHTAPLQIVGPLGLNTVDHITRNRVFLFGFGIGVSVVKGLANALLARDELTELTVVTGSRNEEELLYKTFFEQLQKEDARVKVRFVLSKPHDTAYAYTGHIQEYLDDFAMTNATAYLCGSKEACTDLRERITERAENVEFLIEAFD